MTVPELVASRKGPNQRNVAIFRDKLIAGFNDPVSFARDFLDYDPHPGQVAWFRRIGNDGVEKPDALISLLACGNRWGKTDAAAVLLLHRAFYQKRDPNFARDRITKRLKTYRAINIAMSLDQAQIAWNRAISIAMDAVRFKDFVTDIIGAPFPVMKIANGKTGTDRLFAEVWARSTAKKARYLLGKSFNFCNYDEAAFDLDGKYILEDVLRMRLVDEGGELNFTSTPNGKNWYYELFRQGEARNPSDPYIFSRSGHTFENVNIKHDAVRMALKYMPRDYAMQNIMGKFVSFSSMFPIEAIQRCTYGQDYLYLLPIRYGYELKQVEDDDGAVGMVSQKSDHLSRYVMGVDVARKRDKTVIIVLKLGENGRPHQIVQCKEMSKTAWEPIYELIEQNAKHYGNCPVLIDSTGLGDVVLENLQNRELNVDGYNMGGNNSLKMNLLIKGATAIQGQLVQFPQINELTNQLMYYDINDKRLQTDYVFAFCLAIEAAERALTTESEQGLEIPDSSIYVVRQGPHGMYITGSSSSRLLDDLERNYSPEDLDLAKLLVA